MSTELQIKIVDDDNIIDKNEIDKDGYVTVTVSSLSAGNLTAGDTLIIMTSAGRVRESIEITQQHITAGYVEHKINIATSIKDGKFVIMAGKSDVFPLPSKSFVLKNSFETQEDISYTVTANDFGVYGQKEVDGVEVKTLPTNGALTLNGVAVKVGDTVSMSDVKNGNLKFAPLKDTDENGSFEFALVKNGTVGEKQTLTIDIKAVADMPTLEVQEPTLSEGQGLELTVYNDVYCQGLCASDFVKNSNVLVPLSNDLQGETKPIIALNAGDINCATMMAAKGFVYLEKGQNVSFSGTVDDTVLIRLNGETQLYSTGDAYGSFNTSTNGIAWANKDTDGAYHTNGSFQVQSSGYYKLETYLFNANGCGSHNIKMSVDGGTTYKEINTTNFNLYSSSQIVGQKVLNVGVAGDSEIKLSTITANLKDIDGSETLSIKISDIPSGAKLYYGGKEYVPTSGKDFVTIPTVTDKDGKAVLDGVSVKVPTAGKYALKVQAIATEGADDANPKTATTDASVIQVTAVASSECDGKFISEKCDLKYDISTCNDNDFIVISDDIGSLYNKSPIVNTNGGNDVVKVGGAIDFDAQVNTGDGNDEIAVGLGGIIGRAKVDMGSDDDVLSVKGTVGGMWYSTPEVDLGSGNDTMKVDGFINAKAKVNLGDGDDKLTVVDHFSINQNAKVDGGEGHDILALSRPGGLVDLTKIAKHVDNMEELDVSSWHRTKVNLTVSDIIDMTDNNNVLKISGDSNDTVSSEKTWSWSTWRMESKDSWQYKGTEDGYKKYEGTDTSGHKATLLVEDVVHTDF